METLVIEGGARLRGEVQLSGAKNAALPLLAATLLASGRSVLRNVPALGDVATMKGLLAELGAEVRGGATTVVDTAALRRREVSYERVAAMRASLLVLAPLLARHREARVPLPGGCLIGPRPVDQHLKGLAALGAKIAVDHGVVVAKARRRLRGALFVFDVVTVTGTETMLMAGALAEGRTILENAACEPEIEELALVLNKMGARVRGAGTPLVTIDGVDALAPTEHTLPPDRIEAATFLFAAGLTGGELLLRGAAPEPLEAVIAKARAAGMEVTAEGDGLRVSAGRVLGAVDVATRPHPGFPTDAQPPFLALMTQARGQSMMTESVFEGRFHHVPELCRLGANIVIEGRTAIVRGPCRLQGAKVVAHDLRAAAGLVLAGLIAQGTTEVRRVCHLDRGYERFEKKLRAIGARVRRVRARGAA